MPKINRGNTIKLSVRLSTEGKHMIECAAKNLGISKAGVILFELTKLLKNPPSVSQLDEIKERISLERNHFVITVNEKTMDRVNELAEDYGMKKNILIGYMLSDHFQKMFCTPKTDEEVNPKKLMVQVNEELKKKMMAYSEKYYIPLSALVAYSINLGSYEGLPSYIDPGETVQFFTNVPAYIGGMVKEGAEEENIREHFYTSLCLYKQFMLPEGRFFE